MLASRVAHGLPGSSLLGSLFLNLLAAPPASAQAPLVHVDTFHGVPFAEASRLAITADGELLYCTGDRPGLSIFRRGDDGRSWRYLATELAAGEEGAISGFLDFALGPNDAHLYVTSYDTDAVKVFARDAATGRLTPVQTLAAGTVGLPSFSDPSRPVLSPLGDFLYVAVDGHRVLVLARATGSGRLSFVQLFTSPASSFSSWTSALLMDPDGERLYAVGQPVVSTFARDPSSGRLSFVAVLDALVDEHLDMVSASSGVVSPDGANLYVRGTNPCYNSCRQEGIAVLRRDPISGLPELLETVPESIRVSLGRGIALSPDGRHLYFTDNELGRLRISTLTREAGSGRMELAGEIVSRNPGWSDATALAFEPGGAALYASGFEHRLLPRLERDLVSGQLRFETRQDDAAEGMAGPVDLAVSPGGEHLYVAGFRSAAIARFTWDDAAGALAPQTATFIRDLGRDEIEAPFQLRMTADGRRLYALDDLGSLTTFARAEDGGLELVTTFDPGAAIGFVSSFEVSPDGAHVVLAGFDGLAVLAREGATGELRLVEILDEGAGFRGLALSPDGAFLYALASDLECGPDRACAALSVFARDPASGALTLRDTVEHLGSRTFGSPRSLVLSPDGRHLYVSSLELGTSAVSAFNRDPADGSLELLETYYGEDASEDVFYGYRDLTLAPDGRHLYFLTTPDRHLVVFSRDPAGGALTRLATLTESDLGTLAGAAGVAVSPDSQLIFVSGTERSAVVTFSRRCLTGAASACAGGERFRLDVAWRDFANRTGVGTPLAPVSDDARVFWFFDPDNWEMLVKVLDGCAINDRLWVFAAATTDVETQLTVTDTWTGRRRTYANTLGTASPAVTDTAAFATCGTPQPPAFR